MNHSQIQHICLLMAMAEEAQPIIEQLNLKLSDDLLPAELPFVLYRGKQMDTRITLIVSGADPRYEVDNIGTQAATLMAYVAIRELQPDLIISAGTAGGFGKRGAQVGTVYLSDDRFVFHDRRVPLKGFDESSIGHYPAFDIRQMASELHLPVGVISSGSSLEKSDKDIEVIERFNAVAKEMEAAAIAWVCWLHQMPFMAIKSITNLLDEAEASESQFMNNLTFACEQLVEQVVRVVHYCQNKTLAQLSQKQD